VAIRFSIPLQAGPEQVARLAALQALFVQACNSLTPLVRETHCWNRIGLHHMTYRQLRERFPQLGSQMACNAIYSVSRACRMVYQSHASPWLVTRRPDKPLPLVAFDKGSPVFFDRHTLSLRDDAISMFTLDGRIRFEINLSAEQRAHFLNDRLREVVLQQSAGAFHLAFVFTPADAEELPDTQSANLPEYLVVQQPDADSREPAVTPAGADVQLSRVA
jgi:hypothetical protein